MDGVEERNRVAEARVGRLATTDPDGRPNVVPVCFALAPGDDTLYTAVDAKPKRSRRLRRVENLRARPHATVLVDEYAEDWSRLWWVRLRVEGRVLEAGPEREVALALLREKYEQYSREPPAGPVLALDVREWRSWSAAGGPSSAV